uniref:Uncharacterized protein n=1 Tax=Anopheles darlingi TaxID=43151 RepID=A0A2M4DDC0_ANODA
MLISSQHALVTVTLCASYGTTLAISVASLTRGILFAGTIAAFSIGGAAVRFRVPVTLGFEQAKQSYYKTWLHY